MTIISASAIILDRLVISNRFRPGTFQHLVLSANYIGFGTVPYNNQYILPKGTNPNPSVINSFSGYLFGLVRNQGMDRVSRPVCPWNFRQQQRPRSRDQAGPIFDQLLDKAVYPSAAG